MQTTIPKREFPLPLSEAWSALLDPDAEFLEDMIERSLAASGELDRPSRLEILDRPWPQERQFLEIVRGQGSKLFASASPDPAPVELPYSYFDRISFEMREKDILVYRDEHLTFFYRNAHFLPFSIAFARERKKQRDERCAYLQACATWGSLDMGGNAPAQEEINYGASNRYEFWWKAMERDGVTPHDLTAPGKLTEFFNKHHPKSNYRDVRDLRKQLRDLVDKHTAPRKPLK